MTRPNLDELVERIRIMSAELNDQSARVVVEPDENLYDQILVLRDGRERLTLSVDEGGVSVFLGDRIMLESFQGEEAAAGEVLNLVRHVFEGRVRLLVYSIFGREIGYRFQSYDGQAWRNLISVDIALSLPFVKVARSQPLRW
jgi:hypothetical protein